MDQIHYFNRYTGRTEIEPVYGEAPLRWIYGNPLGRLALHALVKRALFSQWYGWRMNQPRSRRKIQPFIDRYQINTNEFADAPENFRTFNEFFYRKLKPEARPIVPDHDAAVFPADGRHLGFQKISDIQGIFVKGEVFDLEQLLQDHELTSRYRHGSMVLSRLCPLDYHRFHFPVAGNPSHPRLLAGPLFSVSPIALRRNIHILARNKRSRITLQSHQFGLVTMMEVGATNVGSFKYTYSPGKDVTKGSEKGYFEFGGSSVITCFEPGQLHLSQDLIQQSANNLELYARVGDVMGRKS